MRKFFGGSLIFAAVMMAMPAMAEDNPLDKHPFRVGFSADVGVPAGANVGLVIHPKVDWLSFQASLSYNALNVGERLSLKFDPMALAPKLPVGLFLDVQGGWFLNGSVPGYPDLPSVGYHYANFFGGLRLGKMNNFHWLFEAGASYMHITTDNLGSVIGDHKGLTYTNPVITGWIMPSFSTGFEVVFP